jgi:uncharacterized delta-60 repeat protein
MKQTLTSRRWLCTSLLLISCTLAFAQSGSLNKSFGTNGFRFSTVSDQNNSQASTYNVLIHENADTWSIIGLEGALVAYKRAGDGQPAANYGDAGFSDPFSFGENANCLLPDGSVLFAGFVGIQPSFLEQDIPGNLVLGKLNKYGKWDQQFGPDGLKTLFQLKNTQQPIGLGILKGGKILVVLRDNVYQENRLTLVTLLPSGEIDPSLPNNGQLVLPFGEAQETIGLPAFKQQPDKKWILGVTESPTGPGNVQNYLVRLAPDGKPDAGFGIGGVQNLDSYFPPENLVAVGCKKEGGYTLLTSNTGNDLKLRVSHFTATGIPDPAKGGVSAQPVDLPFTAALRSAGFDEYNRFSLLVAEEPVSFLNHFLVRLDASGKRDLTFNQVGYLALQQFDQTIYTGLAITPNKNIMVLGNSYSGQHSFLLQKILAKGQPDPFYDQDGAVTVTYPYASFQWTNLLKISDTKMIAGGFIIKGGKRYWLMEAVNAQGRTDVSFGNGGSLFVPLPENVDNVNMELTNDQKIIVYGNLRIENNDKLFLYKFFADGRKDHSWAANGQKILTTGRPVNSIRLKTQKDGKILVVYSFFRIADQGTNGSDISIQRLLVNGEPDKSFGYSGSRLIDINQSFDYIEQVRLQEDGKILLVNNTLVEMNPRLSLVRLLPDGKYDPSYQHGLKTILPSTAAFNFYGVLLRKDNKLLIAGSHHEHDYQSSAALLQLNSNGTIDRSFATNGIYLNPFSTGQAAGIDVNVQSDGKLLFTCRDFADYTGEIINLRLYPNGKLDESFGVNGLSQHSYATSNEDVYVAKLFPGQLVMAGYSSSPVSRGMLMSIGLENKSTFKLAAIEPEAAEFLVYPNPANKQVTIQWSAKTGSIPKTVELYDMDGKQLQVWQAQVVNNGLSKQQLQLANHAAGNYLLRIVFADGSTKKETIVIVH